MKPKNVLMSIAVLILGLGITSFRPIQSGAINNYNETKKVESFSVDKSSFGELNQDLEFQVRNMAKTDLTTSLQLLIDFSDSANLSNNYYVGIWGEGDNYLPASLSFSVKTSDGTVEQRTQEINKVYTNNIYDGVGTSLGSESLTTYCDIPLAVGEELLINEEIRLFNVFYYDSETKTVDTNNKSYCVGSVDRVIANAYPANYDISNFLKLTYVGGSDYQGYTAFEFSVENFGTELYPTLSTTTARAVSTYEKELASGDFYIKTDFSFGGNTKFLVTLNNDEIVTFDSIAKTHEITNGGNIILLFEGISASDVKDVIIYDFYYNMSIYSTVNRRSMARTQFTQRFGECYTGMVDLYDSNGNVVVSKIQDSYFVDYNIIIILLFTLSTAIFLVVVIPSYFYLKKKNRNDEFKRMNTKSYVSTSIMGYICIESVLLLIAYIILRWTVFDNSLAVFNPSDAYIIVLGVVSIIMIGYFIRYFVILIKNNIEKRKRDKLKINQDVIDDGTLIIRK